VCTWCGRSPGEVSKLIAGPNVFICDACVAAAERTMSGAEAGGGGLTAAKARTGPRCGFCRKRANGKRKLVTGAASVCSECLTVCREILDASGG
jgi:ATP-dependent protease Clp ATPase subunit